MDSASGILVNGARMLPALSVLTYGIALLSGIIMTTWSLMKAREAHASHGHRGKYKQAVYIAVAGVMLINASVAIGIWSETLLGAPQEAQVSILAYQSSGSGVTELSKQTLIAIIGFVQFVGLLAFVRGWHILPRIGERPDATLGKALTHVIGGVLAVNVVTFAKITALTFGIATLTALLEAI